MTREKIIVLSLKKYKYKYVDIDMSIDASLFCLYIDFNSIFLQWCWAIIRKTSHTCISTFPTYKNLRKRIISNVINMGKVIRGIKR